MGDKVLRCARFGWMEDFGRPLLRRKIAGRSALAACSDSQGGRPAVSVMARWLEPRKTREGPSLGRPSRAFLREHPPARWRSGRRWTQELRVAATRLGFEVVLDVEETGSGARNDRPRPPARDTSSASSTIRTCQGRLAAWSPSPSVPSPFRARAATSPRPKPSPPGPATCRRGRAPGGLRVEDVLPDDGEDLLRGPPVRNEHVPAVVLREGRDGEGRTGDLPRLAAWTPARASASDMAGKAPCSR